MREQLIIFTRYPEPGKTKTRLIPALGAEGAAQLQRQMTEHTLVQARKLHGDRAVSLEIQFAGNSYQSMQAWLGPELNYQQQSEGDLGQKMHAAFAKSFADGVARTVAIGTDCPDIDAELLAAAFEAIAQHDLVLGPAEDGGYYLIGLKRLIPELFVGVKWGTSEVLATTNRIAQTLGVSTFLLPLLNDVDRPEDLPIWQRHQQHSR